MFKLRILLFALLASSFALNGETQNNHEIFVAILDHDIQKVEQLIKTGIDVNARSKNGYSVLDSASFHGHVDIVQMLIKAGADVNISNQKQHFPLGFAAIKGHLEIVQLLIEAGADLSEEPRLKSRGF